MTESRLFGATVSFECSKMKAKILELSKMALFQVDSIMKKIFFALCLVFFTFYSSCNQEEVIEEKCSNYPVEDNYGLMKIRSFVELTHRNICTRSDNSIIITPFIFEGDTIMYIVNYEIGWQIFSNVNYSPLVLAYSDHGHLDMKKEIEEKTPIGLHLISLVKDICGMNLYSRIDSCRYPYPIDTTLVPAPIGTRFDFTSIDTIMVEEQNHLITTKWGNNAPWNLYARYVGNNYQHSQIGCSAIAVGQYLYYEHFKIGRPVFAMSLAISPTENNNFFTFANESSTIWEKMAINSVDSAVNHSIDSSAVFLASISEAISSSFGTNGTYASISNYKSYLNDQGFDFETVNIDYDYVINSIKEEEPVILAIINLSNQGHALIADSYRIEHLQATCLLEGMDGNGLTIKKDYENKYIRMNWGWDGASDDAWFVASNAEDWVTTYINPQGSYVNAILFEAEANRIMFKKKDYPLGQ